MQHMVVDMKREANDDICKRLRSAMSLPKTMSAVFMSYGHFMGLLCLWVLNHLTICMWRIPCFPLSFYERGKTVQIADEDSW
uniref:Transmembrane protein n=1 Tax=Angiostrongylus cantonensis TaxID=6313 RepID=A0A0K0CV75_ANGCA